jgi:hypothetical protein
LLDFILASGDDALRTRPRLVEVELIDMILKDLTARQRYFAWLLEWRGDAVWS